MSRLPSAAQGSHTPTAGMKPAVGAPSRVRVSQGLDTQDAEGLLVSLGFLLVPGPPLDRGPAYLLVAVRPRPTLSHFDPERVVLWANAANGSAQTVLEWPLRQPAPHYSWGTIDVVDRLGEVNRFASFGGAVSVARDRDVHAALFRSDAPILSAGGHSGPADPFGADVSAFFGVLRAAAGNDQQVAAMINCCSPVALYAAFLSRSLATYQAAARLDSPGSSRIRTLLRHELCRLEREASADLLTGERLAGLASYSDTGEERKEANHG